MKIPPILDVQNWGYISIAESHRFLLSYCLFQPLQIIRIRMRKSLVEILDHCVQIGQMKRLFFMFSYRWRTDIGIFP